jgi:hypothetical protein
MVLVGEAAEQPAISTSVWAADGASTGWAAMPMIHEMKRAIGVMPDDE